MNDFIVKKIFFDFFPNEKKNNLEPHKKFGQIIFCDEDGEDLGRINVYTNRTKLRSIYNILKEDQNNDIKIYWEDCH